MPIGLGLLLWIHVFLMWKACMCIAGLILEEAAMFGEVGQGVVFRVFSSCTDLFDAETWY